MIPSSAAEAGSGLVLLDNDPAVLDLLVMDLRLEGHRILAAVTERPGAVDACTTLRPDVLVVDLRLGPGPDGLEVAEAILMLDLGIGIVLHTNYVNADVTRRASGLGVGVVEKGSLTALRRAVIAAGAPPLTEPVRSSEDDRRLLHHPSRRR